MNAATRKLVDKKFAPLRRAAERELEEAEAETAEWSQRTSMRNPDLERRLAAAQAIADAMFIAQGLALGAVSSPGVGL